MQRSTLERRRWIGGIVAALLGGAVPIAALALDAPGGPVVLTVTGHVATTNGADGASFDLAMLERLPVHTITTRTPWYPKPRRFTGVRFADLLAAVGAPPGATLQATALNDYRVEIPADDLTEHGALLAYRLDDKPMAVRDKGPLVIVYPFDERTEIADPLHYGRAVWQLRRLDVR